MLEKEILENNRLIAEFLGYVYFEPKVAVDYSDCGGIYHDIDVYSKIPIQVKDYGEGQKYFVSLPNPDFGNGNNPKWNPDIETLDWDSLNSEHYITDLEYHSSFNELMPVLNKITDLGFQIHLLSFKEFGMQNRKTISGFRINEGEKIISFEDNEDMITAIYKSVVKFVKWHKQQK